MEMVQGNFKAGAIIARDSGMRHHRERTLTAESLTNKDLGYSGGHGLQTVATSVD